MSKGLSPQQAEIVKRVANGESAKQAYKAVRPDVKDSTAETEGPKLLRNPQVKNALQAALKRNGIDEDSIAQTLIEIKNNRDWRAKDAFIERTSQFMGYGKDDSVNVQVNNMNVDFISHDE